MTLTLDQTSLSNGGPVDLVRCVAHQRKNCEFEITTGIRGIATQRLLLPRDTSVLALLSYIDCWDLFSMTDITLWFVCMYHHPLIFRLYIHSRHGIKECGDGTHRGLALETGTPLSVLPYSLPTITLECRPWFRRVTNAAHRARDESRHLTRLHLLKELFNVFLNRAVS
jgi:hypothetical protein